MRGPTHVEHLLRKQLHNPVRVITDHSNLQYYREPHKLGRPRQRLTYGTSIISIQLVSKPGAAQTTGTGPCPRRPDLIPYHETKQFIVLPDYLFVSPNHHENIVGYRTRPKLRLR